jgi:hypothetical protein
LLPNNQIERKRLTDNEVHAMKLMRTLTVILGLVIVAALVLSATRPGVRGIGLESGTIELSSFAESALRLPMEEVKKAVDDARSAMFERNNTGSRFAQLATGATWFNIVCSIVITIALGWAGKSVSPSEAGNKEVLVGLPPSWAKVIGFAAALAGASAFAGNEAQQFADRRFEAARQLHSLISETQRALSTGDETSQQEALDRLTLEAQKP